MNRKDTLRSLLPSLPDTWPLMAMANFAPLREALNPTRDSDENPTCDCPKCLRQAAVGFSLVDKTWTCSNELCSAYGDASPITELFRTALNHDDEEETMAQILHHFDVEMPQAEEESTAGPTVITVNHEAKPSQFIKLPADRSQWNIYEAVWDALIITDEHRTELQEKRGLVKEGWIDDCGYKSSLIENYERTKHIKDQFPENKLLESGIFRRNDKREIVIAPFLAGTGMKKIDGEQKSVPGMNPVIIPYVNKHGRITCLRPHKANLTNKEFLKQENMLHYHRAILQLVQPYGECFLSCNDASEKYTLVITEGEFKASALAMLGFAAMAVPGISMFRNEHFRKDLLDMIIRDDIRHIIVAFDREDKSHKNFIDRFESEIYATYMAIILERYQFRSRVCILPDEWMMGTPPKADWDSALAMLVKRGNGNHEKGMNIARNAFRNVLKKTPELQNQFSFFNSQADKVKQHRLNKLLHEPKIFSGGDQEAKDAAEITRWFPPEYKTPWLNHEKIAQSLRDSVGGYYVYKNPTDKQVEECQELKSKLMEKISNLDDTIDAERIEKRKLNAVILAINILLYRMPNPVCDFTARSKYKIICPDGSIDRLVTFKDSHGRESRESFPISAKDLSTATKFREYVTACGPYHWHGGQNEIDAFSKNLDVENYNQTITEIDMMGWHKEHRIWLLGDCAYHEGRCIFPDGHGIIWHKDQGYYFAGNAQKNFTQKPPILFPGMDRQQAKEFYKNMDWNQERADCANIMRNALRLFTASYGDVSGLLHIGTLCSFLAHPELLQTGEGAKPSLWVQGAKGSGKTQTTRLGMMLLAFPWNYNFLTLSGTKVGIERSLMQYSCLPLHLDEWRNKEATDALVGLVRSCFMQQTGAKGVRDSARNTRQVTPMTVPIVTGEDATIDSATESRFVNLTMSARNRCDYIASHLPNIEPSKVFSELTEISSEFYRIGRFLFQHREIYVSHLMRHLEEVKVSKYLTSKISDARGRYVYGVAIASYMALKDTFGISYDMQEMGAEIRQMIEIAAQETSETEASIFRNQFFRDAMTMIEGGVGNTRKLAYTGWAIVDGESGRHMICNSTTEGARRYVYFASTEFYAEYEQWCASRRKTPEIALKNIAKELGKTPYFIKNKREPRVWRFALAGDSPRKWWIMDLAMMSKAEQNIFLTISDPTGQESNSEELIEVSF